MVPSAVETKRSVAEQGSHPPVDDWSERASEFEQMSTVQLGQIRWQMTPGDSSPVRVMVYQADEHPEAFTQVFGHWYCLGTRKWFCAIIT